MPTFLHFFLVVSMKMPTFAHELLTLTKLLLPIETDFTPFKLK
jgi:hypothetical protein